MRNIFAKKPVQPVTETESQTRDSIYNSVFKSFNSELPFQHNLTLFNVMRANFPFLDAIPAKFTRLLGNFELICEDRGALELMNYFKDRCKVNHFQYGLDSYLFEIMDNSIALGYDVSEIVCWPRGIDRLKTTDPQNFTFIEDKQRGGITIGQRPEAGGTAQPLKDMSKIMYLAHDTRRGHPQGYSIFYSLPFVVQILERVYKSVDNTTWRFGDPSLFVAVEGGDTAKLNDLKTMINTLKTQFSQMWKDRRQGKTRDVFGAGPEGTKFKVDIIGGDGKFIDGLEFVWKTLIEDCITTSSLPSWMFGRHWASRDTQAQHENDMVISMTEGYRRNIDVNLERIFDTLLNLNGFAGVEYDWVWNDVNLFDRNKRALEGKLNAEARSKEIDSMILLVDGGFISLEEAQDYMNEHGLKSSGMTQEWFQKRLIKAKLEQIHRQIKLYGK